MTHSHAGKCILAVTPLEERWTPATIEVRSVNWDATQNFTLPWAIQQANATPGTDEIVFTWGAYNLPMKPIFNVPLGQTLEVEEAVILQAGGGLGAYATFTGFRPFEFSHDLPVAIGTEIPGGGGAQSGSVIHGGVFDNCKVPVNTDDGGAIKVTGGQLTIHNSRFTENEARYGGAIYVGNNSTLILDGDSSTVPPDPAAYPEQQGRLITLFKGNESALDGGAIEARGEVHLNRVWFVENVAKQDGGAIDVYGGKLETPLAALGQPGTGDVNFLRNEAFRNGGGVFFNSFLTSSLTDVAFTNNGAIANGGAFAVTHGVVNIADSTLLENTAGFGGGIHVKGTNFLATATVNATNVVFNANNYHSDWIGVYIDDDGILNTSGCNFSTNNSVFINPASNGIHNTDPLNPDTP